MRPRPSLVLFFVFVVALSTYALAGGSSPSPPSLLGPPKVDSSDYDSSGLHQAVSQQLEPSGIGARSAALSYGVAFRSVARNLCRFVLCRPACAMGAPSATWLECFITPHLMKQKNRHACHKCRCQRSPEECEDGKGNKNKARRGIPLSLIEPGFKYSSLLL